MRKIIIGIIVKIIIIIIIISSVVTILVSIIIAIYNRKDELFELLQSLSFQTDKDFEVIIVDDGSKINLLPTVEIFQENMNIQFFRKDNSGPGLSRNYGARRAKNDWLVFVDSDVIVDKDYIQNIKTNIEAGCFFKTSNLNFGILMMPLTSQYTAY